MPRAQGQPVRTLHTPHPQGKSRHQCIELWRHDHALLRGGLVAHSDEHSRRFATIYGNVRHVGRYKEVVPGAGYLPVLKLATRAQLHFFAA